MRVVLRVRLRVGFINTLGIAVTDAGSVTAMLMVAVLLTDLFEFRRSC